MILVAYAAQCIVLMIILLNNNVTMLHHAFLKYDTKIILKEVNANVCFKTKVTLKIKELWQIHALKNA